MNFLAVILFTMLALVVITPSRAQQPATKEAPITVESKTQQADAAHVLWVSDVLKRMQAIKPGMTRRTLLTVFAEEGGLSTGLQRTFASRDCPYFKVDVEFEAVGRPARDENGRVTLAEGSDDIILKISTPYVQFSVAD